jgi:hypothetical protein
MDRLLRLIQGMSSPYVHEFLARVFADVGQRSYNTTRFLSSTLYGLLYLWMERGVALFG